MNNICDIYENSFQITPKAYMCCSLNTHTALIDIYMMDVGKGCKAPHVQNMCMRAVHVRACLCVRVSVCARAHVHACVSVRMCSIPSISGV